MDSTATTDNRSKTMTAFHVYSTQGVDFGIYDADDEQQALDLYAQDAGYADFADLIERVPGSSRDDLVVDEEPAEGDDDDDTEPTYAVGDSGHTESGLSFAEAADALAGWYADGEWGDDGEWLAEAVSGIGIDAPDEPDDADEALDVLHSLAENISEKVIEAAAQRAADDAAKRRGHYDPADYANALGGSAQAWRLYVSRD
jgi:hypothetical protein